MKKRYIRIALIPALAARVMLVLLPALAESAERASGDFRYVMLPDGAAEITGWIGGAAELRVPALLDGCPVAALGEGAFANREELVSVGLPEGLRSIGDHAFADCPNLAQVDLPEGLAEIGAGAFEECMSLQSIALPGSVETVGANPFMGCDALAEIGVMESRGRLAVREGALFADSGALLVCYPRALTRAHFRVPEGTRCIGDYAFHYCDSLVSIALPDSVTEIGPNAFDGAVNVTLVVRRGSAAEAYAVENAMKYTYPDSASWLND